ncbi:hypothetical protein BKA82DRAFT_26371 [Pisolithus tinctorius]|uniref:Uncharacterized protein n=1 Tax=Pisolithus tinctorius Marx 270 TaxID=870435 RepID=A0A0C3P9L9_PISTI|nr:hypothetical protein BKA82DRAFT_26371 [Pisolithus tinctorius]KIO04541.1 hypothetical protein M404DRAFT_26371 [Pisolithus tinctorius Marx 270]
MSEDFEHPRYWATGTGQHQYKWTCVACKDNKWRDARAARRHEKTAPHQENVEHLLSPRRPSSSPLRPDVRSPLLELLTDLSDSPSPAFKPTEGANTQCTEVTQEDYDGFQLDWDAIDHDQLYSASAYDRSLTTLASSLATWLAHGDDLQSSDEDGSDTPPAINDDLYEEGESDVVLHGLCYLALMNNDRTSPAWRIASNATW